MLLALDTSSPQIVAAVHDGAGVVGSAARTGAQAHGELLAVVVQEALTAAGVRPLDLTCAAVGIGPGPFTGLRVGIVTGRVMAHALGIVVGGVCSLDALAWQAHDRGQVDGPFAVVTDARRREVYVATYDEFAVRQGGPVVSAPGDLPTEVRSGPVVGAGAAMYAVHFSDIRGTDTMTGAAVAQVAHAVLHAGYELPAPEPLYLRRPDAVPPTARKPVLS